MVILWIRSEQRAKVPMVDMTMMRLPGVWTTNLVAVLFGFGMFATFAFVPVFLQTDFRVTGYGLNASITKSGLIVAPQPMMMLVAGIASARLSRVLGSRIVVAGGCMISASGMLLIATHHESVWHFVLANSLLGIGFGLEGACLATLIVAAVPAAQTGVASGMNANLRTIGGAIGTAVMAAIVTFRPQASDIPREAGYTWGFTALAIGMFIAGIGALLIPRSPSSRQTNVAPVGEPGSRKRVSVGRSDSLRK